MDEHPAGTLHYGQVGRAVYLPETKAWTFTRSFARAASISYTGVTRTTVPSPHRTPEPQAPLRTAQPSGQRLVPRAHPDLAAHWSLIRDDAFSKIVDDVNLAHDPQVSTLLDVGYAVDFSYEDPRARSSPVAIAASVTGECGNAISFRMMVDHEVQYEGSGIRLPSIGDAETTEWSTHGAPIRQICFAQSVEAEEKATWMAARLSDSTVVFHPLYQRDPMPMHLHGDSSVAFSTVLQNSRLDANPVVDISNLHTGGFAHADVAFNPWYHQQLALVDTRGHWSVWEISGRQRRQKANWTATPGSKGSLPWTSDMTDSNRPRHDGWASILWVADFSTILVSDRRCAMLYQVTGDNARSNTVELGMGKQWEWILDVQRSSQNASLFFVLTTSRLLWFDVTMSPFDQEHMGSPLRPRLSWHHFRDPEDTTLRISELLVNGELNIVLYSRLAELVQVFPCPSVGEEQRQSIVVSDSYLLDVPSTVETSVLGASSRVQYSDFVFREVGHSPGLVGSTPYNPGMTLIKLFWADSSLATHETIFRAQDKDLDEQDLEVDNGSVLKLKRRVGLPREKAIGDDDFIVDDWDESVAPPHALPRQITPQSSSVDLQWTLNWKPVYAFAVADLAADASKVSSEQSGSTFDQLIERFQNDQSEDLQDWQTSETMLELSGGRPGLSDIDQNAHDLARLVATVLSSDLESKRQYPFMTLPCQFSDQFHGMPANSSGTQSPLDLLNTYDGMITEWLTSLSHEIHNSTRRTKEKIIRGIALDLLLARLVQTCHRPRDDGPSSTVESVPAERAAEEPNVPPQDPSLQYPSLQASQGQNSTPRDSDLVPRQVKASDDTRARASTPIYSTLSAFTTFKKPRSMPRKVTNLLSHWQLGDDPGLYEWQKISQRLEEEESQRTSGPSTPKHRGRRKRSQLSRQPEASSVPPTPVAPAIRTWGSQPDPPSIFVMPSSQPTLDEGATQKERGPFGTREAKRSKAKKKRAAGF